MVVTVCYSITIIFQNFEILPPVRGSENIENALKYENFEIMENADV